MLIVLTTNALLNVFVILDILEMESIVGVGQSCFEKHVKLLSSYWLFVTLLTDINECLKSPCHVSASCIDNEGSYGCVCNVGFSGNGLNCSSEYNF